MKVKSCHRETQKNYKSAHVCMYKFKLTSILEGSSQVKNVEVPFLRGHLGRCFEMWKEQTCRHGPQHQLLQKPSPCILNSVKIIVTTTGRHLKQQKPRLVFNRHWPKL
ncbi:hypothetical protein NC652_003945 [Populus alba x Populus x berolinensis]|nr:hypothetical protein NC652_003945 [Populus alba x Populus x berolinensis]